MTIDIKEVREKTVRLISPFVTKRGNLYPIGIYPPKNLPDIVYQIGKYEIVNDGSKEVFSKQNLVENRKGIIADSKDVKPQMRKYNPQQIANTPVTSERQAMMKQQNLTPTSEPPVTKTPTDPKISQNVIVNPTLEIPVSGKEEGITKGFKQNPLQTQEAGPTVTRQQADPSNMEVTAEASSLPSSGPTVTEVPTQVVANDPVNDVDPSTLAENVVPPPLPAVNAQRNKPVEMRKSTSVSSSQVTEQVPTEKRRGRPKKS